MSQYCCLHYIKKLEKVLFILNHAATSITYIFIVDNSIENSQHIVANNKIYILGVYLFPHDIENAYELL